MKPKYCVWRNSYIYRDHGTVWKGKCSYKLEILGITTPVDIKLRFCPHCGRRAQIKLGRTYGNKTVVVR